MSEPLRGVIVSHSAIAQALVPVSNEGCDNDALGERLRQAAGSQPAVLFVDLPGGSCLTNSIRYAKQHADIAVVTGVNLAMLLDFVFHRDVTPAEAARRAADAGAKPIAVPAHGASAPSGSRTVSSTARGWG